MALAFIAALPRELTPLTRGWQYRSSVFFGRIGDQTAVASCAGIGVSAATRACETALAAGPIDTIVSIGFAGSLSCGLSAPTAVSVREVVDAATGECFPAAPLPHPASGGFKPQRLVTLDRVAGPEEKRRLASAHQATLVDMEAAAVARFARTHNLAFACIKAVTDGPSDRLPDFTPFVTPDGHLRTTVLGAWALVHPRSWSPLRQLGHNSRLASVELAKFVHQNFLSPSLSSSVK